MAHRSNFRTTEAAKPPMQVSEEAKQKQLELARAQGEVLSEALREMTHSVAQAGAEKPAGHFLVGWAVEKPEGLWKLRGGNLAWHEPERGDNCHIEISVRDGADGRFIPNLNVELSVLDADGNEVGSHSQPLVWHPWLYHYGRNWQVPGDGDYTLRVRIDMPEFPRHDPKNGERYAEPVQVEFNGVPIRTKSPEHKEPPPEKQEYHEKLARREGKALGEALREMTNNVAQGGAEKPVDDYLVGWAVEKPEGMWRPQNGGLAWQEPDDKNIHIEISLRDAESGRFVPNANVELTVLDADGNEVGTHRQPFVWHPWLYHYGRNWQLPGDGEYTFRVHVDVPEFPRHKKDKGNRFAQPVDTEFTGVRVETGKK